MFVKSWFNLLNMLSKQCTINQKELRLIEVEKNIGMMLLKELFVLYSFYLANALLYVVRVINYMKIIW